MENVGKIHGSVAYAKGLACIPALDKVAMDHVKTLDNSIEYLRAWQKGWVSAMLAA